VHWGGLKEEDEELLLRTCMFPAAFTQHFFALSEKSLCCSTHRMFSPRSGRKSS
jgi:hypothetical protein